MFQHFLSTVPNPNTRETYARGLAYFSDWASDNGVEVTALRVRDVLGFQTHLGSQLSGSSANVYLSALRAALKWSAQMELVSPAVYQAASVVEGVKVAERLPAVLKTDEVQDLLCQPDTSTLAGVRDLAFIALLVSSGIRVGEAVGLDLSHLDLREREAIVLGKGSKERKVFFTRRAAAALEQYLATRGDNPIGGPVFVNRFGGRISVRYMQERVAAYGLGLESGERLHPHTLRHTFATQYLDKTGDIDGTSRQLGHADSKTTRIYTRTATSRLRQQHRDAMEDPEVLTLAPVRVLATKERNEW